MKKKLFSADKKDEINLRSIRFAHLFSQIALLIYCLIYMIKNADFPFWPALIFIVSAIIYAGTRIVITHKEKKEIENKE